MNDVVAITIGRMGLGKQHADVDAACLLFRPDDLTFHLYAAATRMTQELDREAEAIGLRDVRDWMVLSALSDGRKRTQLELSKIVCVDKTTLISILDRLEERRLIERQVDPADRRVRIPMITTRGRGVFDKFAVARDEVEARVLDGLTATQRAQLLEVLARIADVPSPQPATV